MAYAKDVKVYYPIFLDLTGKSVLVAGGGKVALRKTKGLLEAGARVTVVAPKSLPKFTTLPVRVLTRRFRPSDLDGHALAFAATNVRAVNRRVAVEANRRGIPVNVADALAECAFLVPARVRHGDLQVAISTSGRSPRLAAGLRAELEELLRRAMIE
ncbi:MAG: bifunctional precorrin-2 dehydrogenase/sirohydrochlorin ferrochelatase [Bryobacteraceae bacterium]